MTKRAEPAGDFVEVTSPDVVEGALAADHVARWNEDAVVRRRRRAAARRASRKAAPVTTVRADPVALAAAKRAAGGDLSRIRLSADGTITVVNRSAGAGHGF